MIKILTMNKFNNIGQNLQICFMNETNEDTNEIMDSSSSNHNNDVNSELITSSTSDAFSSYHDTNTNRNSGLNVKMPNSSSFSIPNFNSCDSSDLLISHYINIQVIVLKF